jgi:hypothetical protein
MPPKITGSPEEDERIVASAEYRGTTIQVLTGDITTTIAYVRNPGSTFISYSGIFRKSANYFLGIFSRNVSLLLNHHCTPENFVEK